MTKVVQSSVLDPPVDISNEVTPFQYFLVILKHSLQNYSKILKKFASEILGNIEEMFLDTASTLMLDSNLQSHPSVLPVEK